MPKITVGTAKEARSWLQESKLPWDKKNLLVNFVKRFPNMMFYKKERPEADPMWLGKLGEVFLGVYSETMSFEFKFSHFDFSGDDECQLQECFYMMRSFYDFSDMDFSFTPHLGLFEEIIMGGTPLLVFAYLVETLESVLAVKGDDSGDFGIYEFNYGDIISVEESPEKGTINPAQVRLAFPSFYEMMNRVMAIRFSDGTIVEAKK